MIAAITLYPILTQILYIHNQKPYDVNMDSELDLEIEPDELMTEDAHEVIDESDDVSIAGKEVIRIITTNIFDNDLESALITAVQKYFDELRRIGPVSGPRGTDIYKIPELNQTIWDTFHDYEDFVHQNRFENIDLAELGNIIRTNVTPTITEYLSDRIISKSQQS